MKKTKAPEKKSTPVFVIIGPTCTGKTSLAINLCQRLGGEIISADSRQIYKYMDLGTGKMPVKDAGAPLDSLKKAESTRNVNVIKKTEEVWNIDGVNIWGYDLVEPDKYFSSYDFGLFALEKAEKLISENKKIFLTGGTGFYIDTFTKRIEPSFVEPDFEIRKKLSKLSTEELAERFKNLDYTSYQKIDQKNPARLIRAIEKLLATGKYSILENLSLNQNAIITELKNEDRKTPQVQEKKLPYLENARFVYIGLTAPRDTLYQKAGAWVEQIWKAGLLDETKNLIKQGYESSPKLHGLIYKTVLEFLENKIPEKNALQRIKFDMHGYIRRQQTYFKKTPEIVWFDISRESFKENIYNFVNGQAN